MVVVCAAEGRPAFATFARSLTDFNNNNNCNLLHDEKALTEHHRLNVSVNTFDWILHAVPVRTEEGEEQFWFGKPLSKPMHATPKTQRYQDLYPYSGKVSIFSST